MIAAGCKDLRLRRLDRAIDPLFDMFAELMKKQPTSPPRILTGAELSVLRGHLLTACDQLHSLGLSDALGHTDLNPGNILVDGERAVFLDWAEASISQPFFAFEYLGSLLGRLRPDLEDWAAQLKETYSRPWREFYSDEQIERAFETTPLVAVLAFAAGLSGWQDDSLNVNLNLEKLLRSLARRMYAEACTRNAKVLHSKCQSERR